MRMVYRYAQGSVIAVGVYDLQVFCLRQLLRARAGPGFYLLQLLSCLPLQLSHFAGIGADSVRVVFKLLQLFAVLIPVN